MMRSPPLGDVKEPKNGQIVPFCVNEILHD